MTARLVRRNRTLKLKVRVAVASLCIAAAIALCFAEREALARAVGWLYHASVGVRLHHYADCAGVLIEGKLRHEWQKDDLRQLREKHGDFEAALASAIGTP